MMNRSACSRLLTSVFIFIFLSCACVVFVRELKLKHKNYEYDLKTKNRNIKWSFQYLCVESILYCVCTDFNCSRQTGWMQVSAHWCLELWSAQRQMASIAARSQWWPYKHFTLISVMRNSHYKSAVGNTLTTFLVLPNYRGVLTHCFPPGLSYKLRAVLMAVLCAGEWPVLKSHPRSSAGNTYRWLIIRYPKPAYSTRGS